MATVSPREIVGVIHGRASRSKARGNKPFVRRKLTELDFVALINCIIGHLSASCVVCDLGLPIFT
jgi:hypothetical protein